jgi:DNA helicase HerA-like ATPase
MSGPQPWQVLAELPAWQIAEIPRPRDAGQDGGARDIGIAQRVQALVSASGCKDAVAVAWVRDRPGGPVRVLTAGPALASGHDGRQAVLTLPPGARGALLEPGGAAGLLTAVPCWTRIAGITDVLRAERDQRMSGNAQGPPSLEDGLLSAWLDAFGWLLLAEPIAEAEINELAAQAAYAQLEAENFRSPRSRLAARRAGAWHEELREGISAGMWRVHLLAGAATPEAAGRVARLVCASADLRGLPYGLTAQGSARPLRDMLTAAGDGHLPARIRPYEQPAAARADDRSWWDTPMYLQAQAAQDNASQQWPGAEHAIARADPAAAARRADDERDTPVPASPFTASTRLVAALARTPAREVPGLRLVLRPEFDVTPETSRATSDAGTAGGVIAAGEVLDWNRVPAGALTLPLASLNRHVLVCGATGAGKSQTVRNLLEQASHASIPWLVVEPAKAEYRLMAARLPGTQVIVIRPGDLDQVPAGINPLEPASGPGGSRFPLQTHADLLRALFLAAFQADEPFPQVLAAALTRCYEQAGWDLVTGQAAVPGVQPAYPGLEDLQSAAMTVVDEVGYGREIRDNVRGFVQVRIGSLRLGTTGRFLDGAHPLDFASLLDQNVVLEIEDAGDDHDKAFLMGAVLIRLIEHLRLRARREGPGEPRLRHLTVVEEAHRLLRQPPPGAVTGAAAHATEMFADLLAEIRAYGEGLIIAEQIPSKLIQDAIKNTAVKIVHRLPAADDRQTVGATMNMTDAQSGYLVTLPPGEAAIHADGMDYPLLARIPDGTSRESAAGTAAVSAEPVITRRSATCGSHCRVSPCTLGEMRAAQRAIITDPRLTLWAELAVVAHLTGWPTPHPAEAFSADLQALDARLLDCALSHAVSAAVAARVPGISTRVSPDSLATHVTAVLRHLTASHDRACDAEEPRYLAPPWQWILIRDALKQACAAGASEGSHPSTSQWEHAHHCQIPGATRADQLRTVHRWHVRAQRDTRTMTAALWGTRPHTAIEQAVAARATDDTWAEQFADALDAFTGANWIRNLLTTALPPRREKTASYE